MIDSGGGENKFQWISKSLPVSVIANIIVCYFAGLIFSL
jgi:hypothetical protein